MRSSLEETLGAWTEQLIQYGAKLVERRKDFLETLQESAAPIHEELTEGREQLKIAYQPSVRLQHSPTVEAAFRESLREVHQEELRRQVTLVGPHRDEIQFLVSGRDMRTYGSQGQQRTVALSTKLGELAMIRELTGEPPVCILDDVFSELDAMRRRHLMEAVVDECQTFLTTTDLDLLPPEVRKRAQVFPVVEGEVGAGEREAS
jgi:DNA replication and repair protein RecF